MSVGTRRFRRIVSLSKTTSDVSVIIGWYLGISLDGLRGIMMKYFGCESLLQIYWSCFILFGMKIELRLKVKNCLYRFGDDTVTKRKQTQAEYRPAGVDVWPAILGN